MIYDKIHLKIKYKLSSLVKRRKEKEEEEQEGFASQLGQPILKAVSSPACNWSVL